MKSTEFTHLEFDKVSFSWPNGRNIIINIFFTDSAFACKNQIVIRFLKVYSIELTIKLSPLPLIVQRKEHRDAQRLYAELIDSIKKGNQRLLELTCEKVEDKKITVLVSEIVAIQIYEKTSSSGSTKRPGFTFQN